MREVEQTSEEELQSRSEELRKVAIVITLKISSIIYDW